MDKQIITDPTQKALKLNLNRNIYGTIAEIGAGQEVARRFFRAGGASGTIAKTISAYDMAFSDYLYGTSEHFFILFNNRQQKNFVVKIKQKQEADYEKSGKDFYHLVVIL